MGGGLLSHDCGDKEWGVSGISFDSSGLVRVLFKFSTK